MTTGLDLYRDQIERWIEGLYGCPPEAGSMETSPEDRPICQKKAASEQAERERLGSFRLEMSHSAVPAPDRISSLLRKFMHFLAKNITKARRHERKPNSGFSCSPFSFFRSFVLS
jgi:hypothetical protein